MNDYVQSKLESFQKDWDGTKQAVESLAFKAGKQLCQVTEVRIQDNKNDDNSVWVICTVKGGEAYNENASQDKFFYLGRDKVRNGELMAFLELFNLDTENIKLSQIEETMDAVKFRIFAAEVNVTKRDGKRAVWITPTHVTDEIAPAGKEPDF